LKYETMIRTRGMVVLDCCEGGGMWVSWMGLRLLDLARQAIHYFIKKY